MAESRTKRWTEAVSFRDPKAIMQAVKTIAERRGTDWSSIWRESVRYYLASDRLTPQEQAAVAPYLAPKLANVVDQARQLKRKI